MVIPPPGRKLSGGGGSGLTALGPMRNSIRSSSTFLVRHPHPNRSDEEADYLVSPGCSIEQMRALPHRRQDEQLRKRGQLQKGATQCQQRRGLRHRCIITARPALLELHTLCRLRTTAPANRMAGSIDELRRRCAGLRPPLPPALRSRHDRCCDSSTRAVMSVHPNRRRVRRPLRRRWRPTPPAGVARPRLASNSGTVTQNTSMRSIRNVLTFAQTMPAPAPPAPWPATSKLPDPWPELRGSAWPARRCRATDAGGAVAA